MANTTGFVCAAAMQHHQPASGQNALSHLRAEIVKLVHERGRQRVVRRIGGEERRHQRVGGTRAVAIGVGRASPARESRTSAARRTRGTARREWPSARARADLASVTFCFSSSRRIPRKLIANTFTKHVTASAAVSASPAPHSAKTIFAPVEDSSAERSIVCSVSHSLTKPLNGGSAAMDSVPTRKPSAVSGIHLIKPPSRSMSRVPVCVFHRARRRKTAAFCRAND